MKKVRKGARSIMMPKDFHRIERFIWHVNKAGRMESVHPDDYTIVGGMRKKIVFRKPLPCVTYFTITYTPHAKELA